MPPPRMARGGIEELATESPAKLLFKYSWPALVAMTLNALYAVVDRVFIGKGCGVDAMAGLTLAMPIMMLFGAFGVFVGAGHSAVLSIKLGEGDRASCEKLLGELVAFKLLFFFTLPPLVFFNLDTVLSWCGADKVTPGAYEAAKTYLRLVLFSHLFSHLAFGLSAMLRAEGGATRSMVCMVVGFGLNLVLDPLFIFVFGMGIAGAAWATNIAMFASCAWALGCYMRGRTVVRLRLKRIGFYRRLAGRAAGVGLSPFLQQLLSSLIAVSLQLAFARWMPDKTSRTAQIASLGVFQSALILIFMPMLGAQQGLQPIIGFNWGARNFRRVLGTLKTGLWVTAALSFAAFVVQVVPPFPEWIAMMFLPSSDAALVDLAAHDLRVSNCMIWCIAANVVATTYFQSIGRPKAAILLSVLRQGACLLPIVWLLPRFMEDKALAIWLSMPVSDVLCNVATIPPLAAHARFLSRVRSRGAAAVLALLAFATAAFAAAPAKPRPAIPRYRPIGVASVHDPSIFKDRDGRYHVFGTHLASAVSDNLVSWRQTDTLRRAVGEAAAGKIRAYNADEKAARWFDYLWAPDVIYNRKMRKYCVYLSANGDHWQSNIVLLTADRLDGPYDYSGTVVYGGFTAANWRITDVGAVLGVDELPARYVENGVHNGKWGQKFPNCIDPCVFYDDSGGLWMTYGSWSGGIFMLRLDERTGLRSRKVKYPDGEHSDPYFGRKIAGGAYVSGEGSYIKKIGEWYWLFMSYGKLDSRGGYNVRVFRSKRPQGPYRDRLGNTPFYDTYRLNFNDSVGVRLFGAYKWGPDGEGMVAQGHNSAFVDDDGRAYMGYHTRLAGFHEGHYVRVHQLFLNKDGWLVAGPYRMRGERLDKRGLGSREIAGEYDVIVHRLDVDYERLGMTQPVRVSLNPDKTVSGAMSGRWEAEPGTPYVTLSLGGPAKDVYRGVALVMAVDGTNEKTPVFTALGDKTQVTIWGSKARR